MAVQGDDRDRSGPTPPDRSRSDGRPQPSPLLLMGAGVELGMVTAALTFGGWYLDGRWGTPPWMMLIGLAIGVVGGSYRLWRTGKRYFE